MREIKFRGKRKDNGEWIHGNLLVTEHIGAYISPALTPCIEVDLATVGQFVGTFNGQDLYEGDILRVDSGYDIWLTVVQFDQERLAYHRLQDYGIGKIVGNIHDNPKLLKTE
jgi:YopX protein.